MPTRGEGGFRVVDPAKPVWIVRAGKHGQRDAWCLAEGVVGGGWHEVPNLTECLTREDVERVVRNVYGTEKPMQVAVYTGELWALRDRIRPGDTVVLPLKTTSQIAIGTCTSGYQHVPSAPPDQRIQLGVTWERTDLPRSAVKQDLLYTLGSALTVFQASRNDAARRIAGLAANGIDPGRTLASAPAVNPEGDEEHPEEIPDVEVVARDRIVAHIAETFAGHGLATLVSKVLEASGFVCDTAGPGADGGIDIVAGRGALGLDSPKLIVQVKSGDGTVGDSVVRDLQGLVHGQQADQGLLVAWGGLTSQARSNVAHNRFTIRVWDAQALVDAVLDCYDRLPEDIKAELPLKPVWVLNRDEGD
jgi:restriction system protein